MAANVDPFQVRSIQEQEDTTMAIQRSAEIHPRIHEKIEHGRFRAAEDVMREALRLLDERERQLDALRTKLQIGLDELDRGEGSEWSPALMERLSGEADEMYRRGEQPDPDVCP